MDKVCASLWHTEKILCIKCAFCESFTHICINLKWLKQWWHKSEQLTGPCPILHFSRKAHTHLQNCQTCRSSDFFFFFLVSSWVISNEEIISYMKAWGIICTPFCANPNFVRSCWRVHPSSDDSYFCGMYPINGRIMQNFLKWAKFPSMRTDNSKTEQANQCISESAFSVGIPNLSSSIPE